MEPTKDDSTKPIIQGSVHSADSSLLESMLTGDGNPSASTPRTPTLQIQPKSWSLAMEDDSIRIKTEPSSITLKLPTVCLISNLFFQ